MFISVCQNKKFSIIRKNINFPDYWEFPVQADENRYRIWILLVEKLHKIVSSIRKILAIPKIHVR